ncbi:dihydroxyacetone phosphate acyltransferase [Malaya genurostris]|uniref:dihydroxyacetone phosphate acyltransferase n=1 Tax=Malaya genurostris TaxID=325434 RepID=UPI0026F3A291|nr:dihydroxyacetone phosphate acyltransferase [Malaya genurostris]XP_058446347.1 dihydroxyacetone phosphate acyltransferase [Malaya genurostris]XP_058446348.1 dihydroxyacetone phosphate acyltransferase [Malaya genurostris]XP_058446349.1 dihydroxyacetone phosphate acyltransferase [Malaya genurostris]
MSDLAGEPSPSSSKTHHVNGGPAPASQYQNGGTLERNYLDHYKNLLGPGMSHLTDMTKRYSPAHPYPKDVHVTPSELKKLVMNSERIQMLIRRESEGDSKKKTEIVNAIRAILNEIGLDESLPTIRTLGTILNFIFGRILSGLYVNETRLKQLKSKFGGQTVLYLPSHRSYGDFILMSYVSFCYNIAIPGIAAGMDFHAMAFMGSILRNTGAFYMRRSFGNDQTYWSIFKEYMRQLVRAYDRGVEFFIEGTRSRSNKALTPKIGLLSMALEPLFMGEIPDVLVVPVSLSYDRPLEEHLFVYELLGVPKPKESTKGLLKAMSILKENYGSIYFEFGEAISAKEYFGSQLDRQRHAMNPSHVQTLSKSELGMIQNLAFDVVHLQQEKIVLTTFHLISIYYNYQKYLGQSITLPELVEGLSSMLDMFKDLGAITTVQKTGDVDTDNQLIETSIAEALNVHRNILQLTSDQILVIATTHHDFNEVDKRKLKGHNLSDVVMRLSVPIFTLQLYSNPCLHWLVEPALVLLTIKNLSSGEEVHQDQLRQAVGELRNLFASEFVFHVRREARDFDLAVEHLMRFGLLIRGTTDEMVRLSANSNHGNVYLSSIGPFVCCYMQVTAVLCNQLSEPFKEKDYLAKVQEHIEQLLLRKEKNVHPYCLSLDSINLALHSLVTLGAINKTKENDITIFTVDTVRIREINGMLQKYCDLLPFEYLTFQGAVVTESKL